MIRWLLCAIVLLGLTSALRVMTFNVWNSGRHVRYLSHFSFSVYLIFQLSDMNKPLI